MSPLLPQPDRGECFERVEAVDFAVVDVTDRPVGAVADEVAGTIPPGPGGGPDRAAPAERRDLPQTAADNS